MLFPNVCYLVQTVAQAVLNLHGFMHSMLLLKLKLYSLFLWIYSPRVQQHVWILHSLHGGNTLFVNADSPNISHKTMTRFSIAQLTFQKHRFLKLFLPVWQPTRFNIPARRTREKDAVQRSMPSSSMEPASAE